MNRLLFVILMLSFSSCSANSTKEPTEVGQVDLGRYAGLWYEIASFPASFQKGCHCTTAEYQLTEKNFIRVVNSCRRKGIDGKLTQVTGKAFIVPGSNNTRLKVQFFWPFRGDYHIIMLDNDYRWAVVASGTKYLWILSRSATIPDSLFTELTDKIASKGYDISRLQRTVQICE